MDFVDHLTTQYLLPTANVFHKPTTSMLISSGLDICWPSKLRTIKHDSVNSSQLLAQRQTNANNNPFNAFVGAQQFVSFLSLHSRTIEFAGIVTFICKSHAVIVFDVIVVNQPISQPTIAFWQEEML